MPQKAYLAKDTKDSDTVLLYVEGWQKRPWLVAALHCDVIQYLFGDLADNAIHQVQPGQRDVSLVLSTASIAGRESGTCPICLNKSYQDAEWGWLCIECDADIDTKNLP